MLTKLLGAVAIASLPTLGAAATLTGDTIDFTADVGVFAATDVLVGAGVDTTAGAFSFDFDAGVGGDEFIWSASDSGSLAGSIGISLTDLDFDDGSLLIDFSLDETLLTDLAWTITDDSVVFTYSSTGFIGPGTVLSGSFVTAAVPLPAGLPLLLTALGGIALLRRKRAA
ncbi:VPLPA-CTERM sorting domain-containing protein [Flavimaricola marinus]|uniref:VPLPA-CTERM protein sorting domain protein n=1 Tax=Flavimaricola marinus TaxID=1819565 RepID=A0A238LHQ5_9RHOB|nr:VPLPA-CTERM sorting domain-containing protein [Flavimaricola marinus]SMY09073.1 hypothetical protein LOM8899_03235 [Flavimaricola marinus]